MTKRALLSGMTILCACVPDPKVFGAIDESGDTSIGDSGASECTDDCPIALEWELPLLGAPLRGAIEESGSILFIERDEDPGTWFTRVPGDGGSYDRFADVSPLVLDFTACGDVIAATEVQGGGYRMQRLIDGEPDPSWMTMATAHDGGWPAQMGCADDGTIRIVGNDAVDGAPTVYLDVIDTGELVATWSRPFASFVDQVALLGEGVASADADILVWAYTNDWTADLGTAEVVRLAPDLVELETTHLDLGHDYPRPPVPSGDGRLLAGVGDSGLWVQRLDAGFALQGPRIVDSAAPFGGVTRARALADGGIALVEWNQDDLTQPQLRRYDAAGSFVAMAVLGALTENTEGTVIPDLLRDGDDLIVLGIDEVPVEQSVNHILRGWLRRYSFD